MISAKSSVTLLAGLSLGLVIGSPLLLKRDAATVLSDISTIGRDLGNLDSAVRAFDGSPLNAIPVSNAESAVEDDLKQALSDTNASDAFSTNDSTSVTSALTNLEPTILSTLYDLVAKKSEFGSAGLSSTVLSDLQSLQSLTDQLSSALEKKVTATNATTIASGTVQVDAAYSSAIAAYSS